jgi:hypothetical protein
MKFETILTVACKESAKPFLFLSACYTYQLGIQYPSIIIKSSPPFFCYFFLSLFLSFTIIHILLAWRLCIYYFLILQLISSIVSSFHCLCYLLSRLLFPSLASSLTLSLYLTATLSLYLTVTHSQNLVLQLKFMSWLLTSLLCKPTMRATIGVRITSLLSTQYQKHILFGVHWHFRSVLHATTRRSVSH